MVHRLISITIIMFHSWELAYLPLTDYCGQVTAGWVGGLTTDTSTYKFSGIIDGVADAAACTAAGGEWQSHAYPGLFLYITC